MTPQERAAAKRISAVMRAARKRKTLTQSEVAIHLGTTQSALSKIENSILIPSAPQWFEFCQLVGISTDSLSDGYIDSPRSVTLGSGRIEGGFKLPKVYSELRGSTSRTMLPFLAYFENCYGEERTHEWLWDQKIDPDFFVDRNNSINLNFCLDMARQLITHGYLKAGDIPKLVGLASVPATHGGLRRSYAEAGTSLLLIKVLLENARHYECNFRYAIIAETRNGLDISIAPEKHLKEFPKFKRDPELGEFLCQFKQHYFERFSAYNGCENSASVKEVECHYKGAPQCIYQVSVAG